MIYRINSASTLHWSTWDDEYVIFDEGSGQTHQIDVVRAFVLNTLLDGECSPAKIASELAAIPSFTGSFNLIELVEKILNELGTQGLVGAVGV